MKTNLSQQVIQNNPDEDFLKGDVVVCMSHIEIDDLQIVKVFQPPEFYWLEGDQLVHRTDIQLASPAELMAKRRLSAIERSIAEVS